MLSNHPYNIKPTEHGGINFYCNDGVLAGATTDVIADVKFFTPACCTLNDAGRAINSFSINYIRLKPTVLV